MDHEQVRLVFGFDEIIPGIIAAIKMKKNPSIQAAHENFKKEDGRSMINGERKYFTPDDEVRQDRS